MNVTDTFLERINRIAESPLAPTDLHQAERCLLDFTGVTFAGRRNMGNQLDDFMRLGHEGDCSVIAAGIKQDLLTAAMMNGIAAHRLELDDGHRIGAPHLEAVIISTMLGIAQNEPVSVERFIKGVLIGYEATIRLSAAMQPSLKSKGFHATGVCGTIGAACAAGYAIKLKKDQMKGAVSAAASSAAGILQVLDDNSELKPYNVANAIQSGVTAAYMGKCGFRGPEDVLGGKRGYLQAFTDRVDLECLLGETDTPAIFQIYVKPYASCRHSHPAVECVLHIRDRHELPIDEIEDVEVQTYRPGIFAHDCTEISSVSAAKMSTPYSVAAAVVFGSCGPDAFSEQAIRLQTVRSLTKKVRVVENERLTAACPKKRGAIVTIRLKTGQVFTQEVAYPLGEPENPMTDAQLEEKYESLMAYAGAPAEKTARVKGLIWNLENGYKELLATI